MNTSSDYTEYLITATDNENATTLATEKGLAEGSWFRLPSTLNDAPEVFKKTTTLVLGRYAWAEFSEEEYAANSLAGQSDVRILFAKDLGAAARYASSRNWWLHAWSFVADASLDEVIEYEFYCC
jgi:hypothetical protein